jgi:DNA polymerase III epsilon subunit family exonuclease
LFEIVYQYLNARPDGVPTDELLKLLLDGPGHDEAFGQAFLRGLLAEDPRFYEATTDGRWRVVDGHVIDAAVARASFVVVDVETTGQRIAETGITEIGAVRLLDGEIVARFDRLVYPGRPIPPYVAKLTGISDAMVADAPPISAVLPEFEEFARGSVLVAHNAAFDAALLDHHARQILGRPLGLPSVCTLKLARRRFPDIEKASLDALSEYFGIEPGNGARHRALADAELTAHVFRKVLAAANMPRLFTVRELIAAQEDPGAERQLSIRLSRASLESLPEAAGTYRLLGDRERTLLVARADNIRQAVAHLFYGACHLSDRQLRMLAETCDVQAAVSANDLDARIREAEWIRKLRPEYNRADRHLPRGFFVKLILRGPHPRLVVTSKMSRDSEVYIGPLKGKSFADETKRTLARLFGLPTELRPDVDEATGKTWAAAAERMRITLHEQGFAHSERLESRGDALCAADLGVLGRLGKLRKGNRSWLANRPDCIVALPVADGGIAVLLLRDGLCRRMDRLRTRAELLRWAGEMRRPPGRQRGKRVSPLLADVSTILAFRLRERDGDGLVIPLTDGGDDAITTAQADLEPLLTGPV